MQKVEPLFDLANNESDILIYKCPVEISLNQNTYAGEGEVRMQLLPRAKIYMHGNFKDVPPEEADQYADIMIQYYLAVGLCKGGTTPVANISGRRICPSCELNAGSN